MVLMFLHSFIHWARMTNYPCCSKSMKMLLMIIMHEMARCQIVLAPPHIDILPNIPFGIHDCTTCKDVYNLNSSNIAPTYIDKVIIVGGATCDNLGGMGTCDWAKHICSTSKKLSIQMRQLRFIICPKICLQGFLEMLNMAKVPIWNPMACSLNFINIQFFHTR